MEASPSPHTLRSFILSFFSPFGSDPHAGPRRGDPPCLLGCVFFPPHGRNAPSVLKERVPARGFPGPTADLNVEEKKMLPVSCSDLDLPFGGAHHPRASPRESQTPFPRGPHPAGVELRHKAVFKSLQWLEAALPEFSFQRPVVCVCVHPDGSTPRFCQHLVDGKLQLLPALQPHLAS